MKLKGKAHKFGDNVNTDEIIAGRYLNTMDEMELAAHCMEDIDPKFVSRKKEGDVIVAGENFGCGSSREHAPVAIKAAGVSCVIAKSFARIFYRNAINIGLPIFTSPEAAEAVKQGDTVEVDVEKGEIARSGQKRRFKAEVFSSFIDGIISAGGLMAYVVGEGAPAARPEKARPAPAKKRRK